MAESAGFLVGGLFAHELDDLAQMSDLELIERVRGVLDWSTYWEGGDLRGAAGGLRVYAPTELRLWRDPTDRLGFELEARLGAAFEAALPALRTPAAKRAIRVAVATVDDAEHVGHLHIDDPNGPGIVVAPTIIAPVDTITWRWPLRVGTTERQWLDGLQSSSHHGWVYTAEYVDGPAATSFDIIIVDPSTIDMLSDDVRHTLDGASCIIAAGRGPARMALHDIVERLGPPIAVAFPDEPAAWWHRLFDSLSHDEPIDVAAHVAHPEALVAGPRIGLDATASGRWASAVIDLIPTIGEVRNVLPDFDFRFEGRGASEISGRAMAYETAVAEAAMAEPPTASPPTAAPPASAAEVASAPAATELSTTSETAPAVDSGRQLVATFVQADRVLDTVLPPNSDITLAIRIAVPEATQLALGADFPDAQLPVPQATLGVSVTSPLFDAPQRREISLALQPTRRKVPSSYAMFDVRTGPAGTLAQFEIIVDYQNHPLQAALLVAEVRSPSVLDGSPQFNPISVAAPNEPIASMQPIDVALDGRGATLTAPSGAGLDLSGIGSILDAFETEASLVLGNVNAPRDWPASRPLLITLARRGRELARLLVATFPELNEASSIGLRISPGSRVLPLELAYDGPAPNPTAELCEHATTGAPEGACDKVSKKVVCPYAFWGPTRRISRSVFDGVPTDLSSGKLRVSPVVVVSSSIADEATSADPLPTRRVAARADELFADVTHVPNWSTWKDAIRSKKPTLLVALCHTEIRDRELAMHVGTRSFLSKTDLSAAHVRANDSPAPLVVLVGCSTAKLDDAFGTFPTALAAEGAGAVVAMLARVTGDQGAHAVVRVLEALAASDESTVLGDVLRSARSRLLADGSILGLLVVAHGELDLQVA